MTYLYCLVRSARKPVLRHVAGGLPGAESVRALDAGDGLWLIVTDVDGAEYDEAAIAEGLKDLGWVSRRAMGHEAVVERFLSAPALLPMQLLTIFATDERALAYVARHRRRIGRVLARVEGHLEWGVRMTWDERAARAAADKAHASARRVGDGAGSAYLARKRDLRDINRAQLAAARAAATTLHRTLSKLARDAMRHTATEQATPSSRLLLDAAYLVPVARSAAFRRALRQGAAALRRAGIATSLTGPWPPYNFVSMS